MDWNRMKLDTNTMEIVQAKDNEGNDGFVRVRMMGHEPDRKTTCPRLVSMESGLKNQHQGSTNRLFCFL